MSMRVRRLPMPEGGAEKNVYMFINHGCPQSKGLDENADLVLFPVGYYGMEIPSGVAFEVETTEPCPACGKLLRSMFEWVAPRLWTP